MLCARCGQKSPATERPGWCSWCGMDAGIARYAIQTPEQRERIAEIADIIVRKTFEAIALSYTERGEAVPADVARVLADLSKSEAA